MRFFTTTALVFLCLTGRSTTHDLNFGTFRGTDNGVPVQYLADDLTAARLV